MPTLTIKLPRPHAAQREILNTRKRFNVANCGRRFGKSTLGGQLISEPVLKGKPAAWFSPTYKDLGEAWREVKRLFSPVITRSNETEKRIEFVSGGVLEMWSLADPNSGRGRKYQRVIIDEAAKVRKLDEAWNETIRATLADFQGDAYFLSTPKGLNYFFTLWGMADKSRGEWARWRYPTSSNPFIKPEEIESMRNELPERVFQQEILAEFLADGSYFQNIDAAATLLENEPPEAHAEHSIMGGLDFAMMNDYSVLTLGCRECNRVIFRDRFNQIDYTYQRGRIIESCNRYHVSGLLPERNSIGQPNIELLIAAGIPILPGVDGLPGFNTTATTKPLLIQKLAGALEHDGFLVPKDYADELRAYEVEVMTTGHPKFGAPEGLHDDRVISLALAWWAMASNVWLIS